MMVITYKPGDDIDEVEGCADDGVEILPSDITKLIQSSIFTLSL